MNGFINLLKPPGMTSSDVVVFVKRLVRVKTGHAGTLDPEAAGVLPIMLGNATRLFDYIVDKEKTYIAEIALGFETDTQDAQGKITAASEIPPETIGEEAIRAVLPKLTGDIEQIPPAYSAISVGGKKLYDLAREGIAPELPPRRVRVYAIEYLERTRDTRHLLKIHCGKGTYIRTICQDIGRLLGSRAHMSFLLRTKAGPFDIEAALTPDEVREAVNSGRIMESLVPMEKAVGHLPAAIYTGEQHKKQLYNGMFKLEWLGPDNRIKPPFSVYYGSHFVGVYGDRMMVLNPEVANYDDPGNNL